MEVYSPTNDVSGVATTFLACLEAPVRREIEFCKQYGKPRPHVERYLREIYGFQHMSPTIHVQLLQDYLKLAPHLNISSENRFSRPVLRHPDFSPSNILVSNSNEIVGIIDWQHAVILPLCLCAGIPKHYQNWGDPLSEKLAKPETKLPVDFESLDPQQQLTVRETLRKRLVHFYYAALTMRQMPDHFDAIRNENAMLRAKLFDRAGAPWEGDAVSLKYTIIQALNKWPMPLEEENFHSDSEDTTTVPVERPLNYSDVEIRECVDAYSQEDEKMQDLMEMREVLGIDTLGWLPNDEQLESSKALAQSIKSGMLEHSSSETERIAVRDHFPFDDHDEDM